MISIFKGRWKESMPSLKRKLFLSLGSIAVILLVTSIISILEYRRMSSYVSDMIAANIKSISLSQKLADITEEYNHQMLSVVVQNDISLMPEFNLQYFNAQADSLKNSFTSQNALHMVDSVAVSFNNFMMTSQKFDEVFLADNVDTGEWFFGTLQPSFNKFRQDMNILNEKIHEELVQNSEDFDAGFYRSIIPGVVSTGAGLLLIFLLLCFIMTDYVRPIYRISEGLDNYRKSGRKHVYTFDGDDQLANINEGVSEIIEENIELKMRVKALKEDKNR